MVKFMQEYFKKLYKNSKDNYYNELDKDLKNNNKRFIITVNPETLMMSEKDKELKIILNGNYSFVPDGIAVVKAAKKLDINISERITGIDLSFLNSSNVSNPSFSGIMMSRIIRCISFSFTFSSLSAVFLATFFLFSFIKVA